MVLESLGCRDTKGGSKSLLQKTMFAVKGDQKTRPVHTPNRGGIVGRARDDVCLVHVTTNARILGGMMLFLHAGLLRSRGGMWRVRGVLVARTWLL